MPREYLKGTWEEEHSFSPAVVTQGGKTVWLAGVGGRTDEDGNSLAGDFEGQAHAAFRNIRRHLERAGGTLQDIVQMTVYIVDVRHGARFADIRKEYFSQGYPGSALIPVPELGQPDMMIEIQAIAVVGDDETNA